MKLLKIVSLCLCCFALLSMPLSALSEVRYDNGAQAFIVMPSNHDLFQNFKNVMPGQTYTQTIAVVNDGNNHETVDLSMSWLAHDPVFDAFLASLMMEVKQGDVVLYQGSMSKSHGLKNLGTFEPGQSAQLDITLSVPTALDNQFMNAHAEVVWIFDAVIYDSEGSHGAGASGGVKPGGGIENTENNVQLDNGVDNHSKSPFGKLPSTGIPASFVWCVGVVIMCVGIFMVRKKSLLKR